MDAKQRVTVTVLPVDNECCVCPDDVRAALRPNTALVTIMHSNNEVGSLQPIRRIGDIIAEYNATSQRRAAEPSSSSARSPVVLFHSDGAQSLGKVLIDVQREHIDLLTIVGHKFGAPKGEEGGEGRGGMADPHIWSRHISYL